MAPRLCKGRRGPMPSCRRCPIPGRWWRSAADRPASPGRAWWPFGTRRTRPGGSVRRAGIATSTTDKIGRKCPDCGKAAYRIHRSYKTPAGERERHRFRGIGVLATSTATLHRDRPENTVRLLRGNSPGRNRNIHAWLCDTLHGFLHWKTKETTCTSFFVPFSILSKPLISTLDVSHCYNENG